MTFDITKCKPFDLERALAGTNYIKTIKIETEIEI